MDGYLCLEIEGLMILNWNKVVVFFFDLYSFEYQIPSKNDAAAVRNGRLFVEGPLIKFIGN